MKNLLIGNQDFLQFRMYGAGIFTHEYDLDMKNLSSCSRIYINKFKSDSPLCVLSTFICINIILINGKSKISYLLLRIGMYHSEMSFQDQHVYPIVNTDAF